MNNNLKYFSIIVIVLCICIRIAVAIKVSITQSFLVAIKKDESGVLDENRKLKEKILGSSLLSLEKRASDLSYSYPKKILYLKNPENIAGL